MVNLNPTRITVDGVVLTAEQTREVLSSLFEQDSRRHRLVVVAAVCATLLAAVPLYFVHPVFAVAAGVFVPPLALRRGCLIAYRRQIREAMRQFGHVLCPACGHSLKGLRRSTADCPECGERLMFAPWYHEEASS